MSVYFIQKTTVSSLFLSTLWKMLLRQAPGRMSCPHKLIHSDIMSSTQQQCHQQAVDSSGALHGHVVIVRQWVKMSIMSSEE